jgi:hypothetical protein
MVATAVHPGGVLGYVQKVGDRPDSSQPVTYDSTADFGVGGFLLGGTELAALAVPDGSGSPAPGTYALRARINNRFVTAEDAGASPLIANRPTAQGWETFDLTVSSTGGVTLRAHAKRPVRVRGERRRLPPHRQPRHRAGLGDIHPRDQPQRLGEPARPGQRQVRDGGSSRRLPADRERPRHRHVGAVRPRGPLRSRRSGGGSARRTYRRGGAGAARCVGFVGVAASSLGIPRAPGPGCGLWRLRPGAPTPDT